jgi:hypothetical protein
VARIGFGDETQIAQIAQQLREIELKVQREINEKRQELLAKEESLRSVSTLLPCARCIMRSHAGIWRADSLRRGRKTSTVTENAELLCSAEVSYTRSLLSWILSFVSYTRLSLLGYAYTNQSQTSAPV